MDVRKRDQSYNSAKGIRLDGVDYACNLGDRPRYILNELLYHFCHILSILGVRATYIALCGTLLCNGMLQYSAS